MAAGSVAPRASPRRALSRLLAIAGLLLVAFIAVATLGRSSAAGSAFVGSPTGLPSRTQAPLATRRADPPQGEVVDAEMAEEGDEEEVADDDEEASEATSEQVKELAEKTKPEPRGFVPAYLEGLEDVGKPKGVTEYGPEAYTDYGFDETPPEDWFERRKISKRKVNMYFFNMFKKPREFFPHDIKPGDTLRVFFKDPSKGGEEVNWKKYREVYFDGVCLDFKGDYHARNVRLRAMVGKGEDAVGYEMTFPIHSDLVTKIEVLRRGYIGRNKNAYFLRGMIGKKNQIPLDKQRTTVDELYAELREEGREDEIPLPDYPQKEHDRLPYTVWKQDSPHWDESMYNPDEVDQRGEFEKRAIAAWRKKTDPKQKKFR